MGWPSPGEALRRVTTLPFSGGSSSLIAREVSLGKREWYGEALSVNGHAFLIVDASQGRMVRVLVAVRVTPWEGSDSGAREEWGLVWERWTRILAELRALGAMPVGIDEEWIALGVKTDRVHAGLIAGLLATARGLAGVRGYTGSSSALYGYDLPSASYRASELVQEIIGLVTMNMLAGLDAEGRDEGAWDAIRYLAENSLYLGVDMDMTVLTGEPPSKTGEVYTIRRLHQLLSEIYGETGPVGAVSLESLRRALREYMGFGAARTCKVEAVNKTGTRRRYEAVYFDLRHELALTPFIAALENYGGIGLSIGCAVLPYITGAGHSRWSRSPGALQACRRACEKLGLCGKARKHELERRGWPDSSPIIPGPCYGVRKVLAASGAGSE